MGTGNGPAQSHAGPASFPRRPPVPFPLPFNSISDVTAPPRFTKLRARGFRQAAYTSALAIAILLAWHTRVQAKLSTASEALVFIGSLLVFGALAAAVSALGDRLVAARERIELERLAAESAVHERGKASALVDTLLDAAPLGFAFVDQNLRYVRVNETLAAIAGLRREDMIGRTIREVVPTVADQVEPLYRHVIETGESIVGREVVGPRPSNPGKTGHWLANYYPVRNAQGDPIGVGAALLDVSERRRMESELLLSEERYRLVARAARDVIWDWDLITDRVITSAAMLEVFGHDPVDVERGTGWWMDHLHPDDRDRVWSEIQNLVSSDNAVWTSEYRLRRADGQWAYVTDRGWLLRDADQKATRMVGALSDVTAYREKMRHERFLAEVSEAIAGSLDHSVTLDTVARLVVEHLADRCSIDLVNVHGDLLFHSVVSRDPEMTRLARELREKEPASPHAAGGYPHVIRTGKSDIYEQVTDDVLRAIAETPERLEILRQLNLQSVMIVPLRARGRTIGALTIASHTPGRHFTQTDLAVAEELGRRAGLAADNAALFEAEYLARGEAEAANRAKADFLAVMSHELRTPLNAIGGYTQLLRMGLRGPVTEAQAEDLDRITRSQRTLLTLINDILSFARVEAGRVELTLVNVVVSELFSEVEELIAPQLRSRDIAYHVNTCPTDAVAHADRDKVRQILANLLANAIKFTPSGGVVEMGCATRDDHVVITVTDTGRGIPADKIGSIFEPFMQIDTARTREHDGVGLGLAISYEFAKAMGGDLTVESIYGEGSTFSVMLPRARVSGGSLSPDVREDTLAR